MTIPKRLWTIPNAITVKACIGYQWCGARLTCLDSRVKQSIAGKSRPKLMPEVGSRLNE